MKLNKIEPDLFGKIIYGGLFKDFSNKEFVLNVNSVDIKFKPEEFLDNSNRNFKELRNVIGDHDFMKIVHEGGFQIMKPESLGYSKYSSDMSLEYCCKNNILFVFTFGEKQPSLWILILEGIWQIK